jgi:hypothetical protein
MGIRISEMEEATTFGADDYVPIVTNGTNKKALGAKIKDFIAGFFATKNGDNITDDSAFRTAIGINAVNTPFVNTGTGMTAEDVQAGIEELNTSKANIDGSNIANPSAFRSNIGANASIFSDNFTATIATGINLNTTVYTKALTAGIYVVTSTLMFQTETSAEFKIGINGVNRVDLKKPSGGWFTTTVANVFEFSNASNLAIFASHNVGSNVAMLGNIQLVKLAS